MPETVGSGAAGQLGQRLPECWLRTEKSWVRPPELAPAKKTRKTGLVNLKPAGLLFWFVFFFLSDSLLLFFNCFSFF